jgi:predicted component of type VI protein secretion system
LGVQHTDRRLAFERIFLFRFPCCRVKGPNGARKSWSGFSPVLICLIYLAAETTIQASDYRNSAAQHLCSRAEHNTWYRLLCTRAATTFLVSCQSRLAAACATLFNQGPRERLRRLVFAVSSLSGSNPTSARVGIAAFLRVFHLRSEIGTPGIFFQLS